MNEKTFVVTWQTVVEMNAVSDTVDALWAVCKAKENLEAILRDPENGDNYFIVQELGNRPAPKHFITLASALDAYPAEAVTRVHQEPQN